MSEPENFLTRWSRRKLEPAEEKPADEAPAKPEAAGGAQQPATEAKPEFDVSTLPSLESIGPSTDISAFLQAGVPSVLRNAALRQAWSADPAIRDFVGLNENYWDATGFDNVPGFGALDPSFDAKKMAARIFGDREPEPPEAKTSAAEPAEPSGNDPAQPAQLEKRDQLAPDSSPQTAEPAAEVMVQREDHVASHQADDELDDEASKPRRHGSALPQ